MLTVRRLLLVAAFVLPSWAEAQTSPIRPDQAAFRALYKELVETNTTASAGDCTLAAQGRDFLFEVVKLYASQP